MQRFTLYSQLERYGQNSVLAAPLMHELCFLQCSQNVDVLRYRCSHTDFLIRIETHQGEFKTLSLSGMVYPYPSIVRITRLR